MAMDVQPDAVRSTENWKVWDEISQRADQEGWMPEQWRDAITKTDRFGTLAINKEYRRRCRNRYITY